MSSNDDLQNKLREGVEKARAGDRLAARRLLEEVVEQDPVNEMGWLWLASCVNTVVERRACLQHVLEINPNNDRAKEALRRLSSSTPTTASAPPEKKREIRDTTREAISSSLRAREEATNPRRRQTNSGGGGGGISLVSILIILGVIASVIFIGFMGVQIANDLNPTLTPTATVYVTLTRPSLATDTPVPTITPEFSRTPMSLDDITPLSTFPPTFTPTFTPSPSPTFTPSPEPLPLNSFELVSVGLSRGSVQPDAYTLRGDGGNVRELLTEARDIAFAPDGEQIAFVRDVGSGSEIFIGTFDEPENARQLTSFGVSDTSHPSWSPDGERLVFSSSGNLSADEDAPEDASLVELWVINADGTNLQQLTNNNFIDIEPSWSPIDNRVVFTSGSGADLSLQTHIVVINVDSRRPDEGDGEIYPRYNQLTTTPNNYAPSWSFDGTQIAFVSDRFGDGDVWVMDDEGFSRNLVTVEDGVAEDLSPVISPDGRWIAFVSNREDDRFQTYMINFDGTVVERVTNNQREDESIIFRPIELELP